MLGLLLFSLGQGLIHPFLSNMSCLHCLKKTRIINQTYKQSSNNYVCVCVCVRAQERWCANVPGLNHFLGIETSHASLYLEAWLYPEVTEALIPHRWPHNQTSR